jgi:hypothetical protein
MAGSKWRIVIFFLTLEVSAAHHSPRDMQLEVASGSSSIGGRKVAQQEA